MKIHSHHTRESIQKMRISLKGKVPWNKGKKGVQVSKYKGKKIPWLTHNIPHSEETKLRISRVKKENPTRYWLGKSQSDDHKRKVRFSRCGISYETPFYIKKYNRYGKIKENGGIFTKEEWEILKEIFQFTCIGCLKKEPEVKLTKDHIQPISKGGRHEWGNIQPLCGSCNNQKKDKYFGTYGV